MTYLIHYKTDRMEYPSFLYLFEKESRTDAEKDFLENFYLCQSSTYSMGYPIEHLDFYTISQVPNPSILDRENWIRSQIKNDLDIFD